MIFLALTGFFLIFYTLQIPRWTSNADVLVYSLRSSQSSPIVRYAFLDYSELSKGQVLANYHLAHTLILWLVYHLVPKSMVHSILPSGIVSAVSGALVVGLTFFIWLKLKIKKFQAFYAAVIVGIIPSIWFHSIIGEVYALQLLFILLFLFFYLSNRFVLSCISLVFALLVSPISFPAFAFIFIKLPNKSAFFKAVLIGVVSFLIYIGIIFVFNIDIFSTYKNVSAVSWDMSFITRFARLGAFMILNFSFFIYFLFKGSFQVWKNHKRLFLGLLLAAAPQFFLILVNPTFVIELGCFQLPLFWILALPVGLALAKVKKTIPWTVLPACGLIAVMIFFWIIPNRSIGKDREQAGFWLRKHVPESVKLTGDWGACIGLSIARCNWNIEKMSENYIFNPDPKKEDCLASGERNLLLAYFKKQPLYNWLSHLPIAGIGASVPDSWQSFEKSTVKKIYESQYVRIVKWNASPSLK